MSRFEPNVEPSMEEILASIRKIIAEDTSGSRTVPPPAPSRAPQSPVRPNAGVRPAAPGFARVEVRPSPGELGRIEAKTAHPRGAVETKLVFRDGRFQDSPAVVGLSLVTAFLQQIAA